MNTGKKVLGKMKRSFSFKDKDYILQLHKSVVRSHLE